MMWVFCGECDRCQFEEGGRRRRRRRRRSGYRSKNKNPTRQCGEQNQFFVCRMMPNGRYAVPRPSLGFVWQWPFSSEFLKNFGMFACRYDVFLKIFVACGRPAFNLTTVSSKGWSMPFFEEWSLKDSLDLLRLSERKLPKSKTFLAVLPFFGLCGQGISRVASILTKRTLLFAP